jgi:Tfp pilus assembly protein PilF
MTSTIAAAIALAAQIVVNPPVPASEQDRREAFRHFMLGREYLTAENWDKAAHEFRAAISRDAMFTDAYFNLGHAYMGLQRHASAIQAYQQTLAVSEKIFGMREADRAKTDQMINDQLKAMREALAQTSRMGAGQRNAVIGIESRIRELERSKSALTDRFEPPAQVLLSLGSAHFRNGNAEAARQSWERAVKSDSKLGEAWNNLAVVYLREGRRADAEAAVRNAEKNGFRVNPRLKEDIKNIRS